MSTEPLPYHLCCKALEHLYLKDSYVLNISTKSNSIFFDMEFVLTEKHELYHFPRTGEQYCYRRGKLEFNSYKWSNLQLSNRPPSTDATGEKDYGNIDYFVKIKDGYFLEGDWGSLETNCEKIAVEYELDGASS